MKYSIQMVTFLCLSQCGTMVISAILSKPPTCDEYNRKYLHNLTISMNTTQMNLDVDVVRPLYTGLRLQIEFFTHKYKATTYQSFYQYSLDMCNILNIRKNNMFKKWIFKFKKHGNFLRNCPFPVNHYYVRDYNSSVYDIPSFFFPGIYRIAVTLFQGLKDSSVEDFLLACIFEVEVKLT